MIVLIRHAQPEGGDGFCIGQKDIPLSPDGREQAESVCRALLPAGFVRICASPASRAIDTVRPLAALGGQGWGVEIFPGLAEIDMGEWDGLPFADIIARYPEEYRERGNNLGSFRTPGGESFNDVADRALETLRKLSEGPRPVLCATHAGVIRSVLCRLSGRPMDELFHFKPRHGAMVALEPDRETFRALGVGITPEQLFRLLKN